MSSNDKWISQVDQEWNQIDVPQENVSQAVQQGLLKAKKNKRRIRRGTWSTLVAAAIVLLFITSIRVSPAFAQAVGQIPGMERIVSYVQGQQDRGLMTAIENDYYQTIGISQELNHKTLTIDGVIPDENGMVVFYTIESAEDVKYRRDALKLYAEGEYLPSAYSFHNYDAQTKGRFEDVVHFSFQDPIATATQQFTFEVFLEDAKDTTFRIDFTLPKAMEPSKIYTLNDEVEIDGNILHFKQAVISPTRVGITIAYDENNPSTIYYIEQLELRDRSGDTWETIQNGLSGTFNEDKTEETYYFQSSYFDEPEGLTLFIDRVQALPKGEDYLLVNFENREVLYTPPYADMEVKVLGPGSLEFTYEQVNDTFSHSSLGSAQSETNDEIYNTSSGFSTYEGRHHYTTDYPTEDLIGDVRIEFDAFPHYLEGSAEVVIVP